MRIWHDEQLEVCNPKSAIRNLTVRLPTEAEWEKAARGTDGRTWPWGNTWDPSKANTAEGGPRRTEPVDNAPDGASPYGCLDMIGNVWEWCADWYAADYYQHSPAKNPAGPDSGSYRMLRGGSWVNDRTWGRAAYRYCNYPDGRYDYIGFRCCLSSTSSL